MRTNKLRLSLALGALAAVLGGSVWGASHAGSSAATASFDWTEATKTDTTQTSTAPDVGASAPSDQTQPGSVSLLSFDWT